MVWIQNPGFPSASVLGGARRHRWPYFGYIGTLDPIRPNPIRYRASRSSVCAIVSQLAHLSLDRTADGSEWTSAALEGVMMDEMNDICNAQALSSMGRRRA